MHYLGGGSASSAVADEPKAAAHDEEVPKETDENMTLDERLSLNNYMTKDSFGEAQKRKEKMQEAMPDFYT